MKLTIKYPFLPKARSPRDRAGHGHVRRRFRSGRARRVRRAGITHHSRAACPVHRPERLREEQPPPRGAHQLAADARHHVLDIEQLTLPEKPLVDALPLPTKEALDLLTACGLSEAQLLLRTPAELSDGQRYRFRLALALAELGSPHPRQFTD